MATVISSFNNCRDLKPKDITVVDFLKVIKLGAVKDQVTIIRGAKTPEERTKAKQDLPAVVIGAKLKTRSEIEKASGLACLDFDKVEDLQELKAALEASKYILAYFISPSGNGIKAIVKIPEVSSKKEYQEYYLGLLKHFAPLNPDEATKDITRLCFISYDPQLYINKDACLFTDKVVQERKKFRNPTVSKNLPEGQIVDRLLKWWVKKYDFSPGARNNSLFVLACSFSDFGVSKNTTEDVFNSFEDKDFTHLEIQTIIDSAYRKASFNTKSFPQ